MVTFLVYWIVGWVVYELLAILLMAEWYVQWWLAFLLVRFFTWPLCAVLMVRDLVNCFRRWGRIELWWLNK